MAGTNPTKTLELNPQQWMDEIRGGNRQLLDEFYLNNREDFIGWGLNNYRIDREQLVDIYQDTIIIFYENILYNRIKDVSSNLKTYLYGIAKNLILKKFRDDRKIDRHEENVQEHLSFQAGYDFEDLSEIKGKVKTELDSLGEPCRSILELFYVENQNIETIAQKLDYKSKDVVKTQKSRCLKTLKEKILQANV